MLHCASEFLRCWCDDWLAFLVSPAECSLCVASNCRIEQVRLSSPDETFDALNSVRDWHIDSFIHSDSGNMNHDTVRSLRRHLKHSQYAQLGVPVILSNTAAQHLVEEWSFDHLHSNMNQPLSYVAVNLCDTILACLIHY